MKVTGIIAEYNPFHNGHQYHLKQARRLSGADYVITVISGDFVQRGAPAIIDKYIRTKMALLNGADLVLELPAVYASGSAEFFAAGAVALLDRLGIVDSLCFGSECGNLKDLEQMASVLLTEPEIFRNSLQDGLKNGLSFPKARAVALQKSLPAGIDTGISAALPNNILAVEYLKALWKRKSPIVPITLQRQDNGYHNISLTESPSQKQNAKSSPFSSASAIRSSILSVNSLAAVEYHMPSSAFRLLKDAWGKNFPISSEDFSLLLQYRLLTENGKDFCRFQDVTQSLSDKIQKNLYQYESFEQFCGLLKSKDMTYARLSRCLIHILLGMTASKLEEYLQEDFVFYARILGFKKDSRKLLGMLKAHTSIPLISKLANASSLLPPPGQSMLEEDILSAHIYDSVVCSKFNTRFTNEYAKQLVIL